jgi:phosphoglycolate phosphatase-like HAD superfamily hydrolase
MIGDTTVDLQTAQNAGIRSILVCTGYAGRDGRWPARPDFEFADIRAAVEFVTETGERS